MPPLHIRKKVRFSEDKLESALHPKIRDADGPVSHTLLPEPEMGNASSSRTENEGPEAHLDPEFAVAVRAFHRSQVSGLRAGEAIDLSIPDNFSLEAEDEDEEARFTEDGIPIEPFNTKAESSSGYFDDDGNYFEYRQQDDTDAWLESLPAQSACHVVSSPDFEGSESQAKMELKDQQIHWLRIIQRLARGETVLDALRRLGSVSEPHASDAGLTKAERNAQIRARLAGTVPERNRQTFEDLTEDAGQLLNAGDTEIYTLKREALLGRLKLERALRFDHQSINLIGPASGAPAQCASNGTSAEAQVPIPAADPLTDIFADSLSEPAESGILSSITAVSEATGEPQAEEFFLIGMEDTMLCDDPPSMAGFEFDDSSGMYYNTQLGCYFDTTQQLYGDASSGQWFSFEDGKYKLVSA